MRNTHNAAESRLQCPEPRSRAIIVQMVYSKGEPQGRHQDPAGGFTRKHDQRGPNGQLPCILDQQKPPLTLRDQVQSSSALSALKKSLVANLSAKRKLSVAKLSAKRNVSLAKRDFLVANGRMAADFSSPVDRFRFRPVCRGFRVYCSNKPTRLGVRRRMPSRRIAGSSRAEERKKNDPPTVDLQDHALRRLLLQTENQ